MNDKFRIPVPKLRGEDNHSSVTVRMANDLVDRLESIAGKTGYSRSRVIIMALEYALDRLEIDEQEQTHEEV
ncbi:MAG: ribbon-helix-helix domain-containing protein [Oscillospiraceae bacterium]|nr:ribbon-helix-helix domain-containing protein [Oscillospiraceae bacterium]